MPLCCVELSLLRCCAVSPLLRRCSVVMAPAVPLFVSLPPQPLLHSVLTLLRRSTAVQGVLVSRSGVRPAGASNDAEAADESKGVTKAGTQA